MNEKRLKKYEYLSSKIRTQFFIILVIFLLPLIVLYFYLNERANIIDDFNNNKELICNMSSLKIDVSKELAYEFDKKRAYQITNGVNIFTIYNCDIK